MKRLALLLLVAEGLLLVGGTLVLVDQYRLNARLRSEIATIRPSAHRLIELQTEHARLAAINPARAEMIRTEEDELSRLRAGVKGLKLEAVWAKETGARLDEYRTRAAAVPARAEMLEPSALQNAGRATPAQAWQTQQWAIRHADTQVLAECLAFEPEVRASLERTFADLPIEDRRALETPERMAATMITLLNFAAAPLEDSAGFPRRRIVSHTQTGPDEASLVTEFQDLNGRVFTFPPTKVRRYPDGWKQVVGFPPEILNNIGATFKAMPPPQREKLLKGR